MTLAVLHHGVCAASVRWLLRHDTRGVLRFAPLQGEAARSVPVPPEVASRVLVEGDCVSWHAGAVRRLAASLPRPWRLLRRAPVTDGMYRAFAGSRYRIDGRLEPCRIPSPAERGRFLP